MRTREASRGSPSRPTAYVPAILPGRLPAARLIGVVCALLLVLTTLPAPIAWAGPGTGHAAIPAPRAAPHAVRAELLRSHPSLLQPTAVERELDDLEVRFIEPNLDPETVLRSRPFIMGPDSFDAFPFETTTPRPMSYDHARDRLERFLKRRGLSFAEREAAVAIYDDPTVQAIVPAPNLRAGLLMLTDWDPYQITIDAILSGENPSGEPFAALEFADIGVDGAVATIDRSRNGRFRMIFNEEFAAEPPEQLIPVIVHESLHGGGFNSRQEEVIANILDTICYGEIVLIDPRVAEFGTGLAVFNNVELLALLNSMGRAGGGEIGTSSSPFGDVFVGPNLEDLDAESIQAVIGADAFYGSLPQTGSPGQQTFSALVGRYSGADRLGEEPDYSDAALAVIDEGAHEAISARAAIRLALTLGLVMTGDVVEVPAPASDPDALDLRPFIPAAPELFGARYALPAADARSTVDVEDELRSALIDLRVDRATRQATLRRFADEDVERLIPDPTLRAATVLLDAVDPWDASAAVILDGTNDEDAPFAVAFADLPGSGSIVFLDEAAAPTGRPTIVVSTLLRAEPVPVLASYLVEATLIHEEQAAEDEAVAAALLGTLAYADFVAGDPALVERSTWGVIQRNRDLLALINSTSWSLPPDNLESVGFLRPSNGAVDILPGLYDDAASFAEFITARPRSVALERRSGAAAPPVFADYLDHAGADLPRGSDPSFDAETLGELDAHLDAFFSPDDALVTADILQLGAV